MDILPSEMIRLISISYGNLSPSKKGLVKALPILAFLLVFAYFLLSFGPLAFGADFNASCSNGTYYWNQSSPESSITSDLACENAKIILNCTVNLSANWTLSNVTLELNQTANKQVNITIKNTGYANFTNLTFNHSANGNYSFSIINYGNFYGTNITTLSNSSWYFYNRSNATFIGFKIRAAIDGGLYHYDNSSIKYYDSLIGNVSGLGYLTYFQINNYSTVYFYNTTYNPVSGSGAITFANNCNGCKILGITNGSYYNKNIKYFALSINTGNNATISGYWQMPNPSSNTWTYAATSALIFNRQFPFCIYNDTTQTGAGNYLEAWTIAAENITEFLAYNATTDSNGCGNFTVSVNRSIALTNLSLRFNGTVVRNISFWGANTTETNSSGYIIGLNINISSLAIPNSAPSSTLNSPSNANISISQSITFNCSATDDRNLANITLYGNWSGWHANETKSVGGQSNSTTFTKTLSDGSYKWNCLAQDNDTSTSFANQNYTFTIDSTPPAGVSGLANQSSGDGWIYWTWTNPGGDWNHTEVWINGTFMANVTVNYYNATGLNISYWYEIQLRTADNLGNINATWVNSSASTTSDSVPILTILSPSNTTYARNWTWANVSVNEPASWCGVSLNGTANQSLTNSSYTSWYLNISVAEGQNNVVFYCNDTTGNMENTTTIYFSADTTPPLGVSGLSNQSSGDSWIYWTWTNPSGDWNHTEVWINGTWYANTTNEYYNATELTQNSLYEIQLRTVDNLGNINATWVNSSAFTISDSISPVISGIYVSSNLIYVNDTSRFNATVDDNINVSAVKFNIQTPSGTYNITATNSSATHFYVICNRTNTCNTSMVGQYNLTSVWANDTNNNPVSNNSPLKNFSVLSSPFNPACSDGNYIWSSNSDCNITSDRGCINANITANCDVIVDNSSTFTISNSTFSINTSSTNGYNLIVRNTSSGIKCTNTTFIATNMDWQILLNKSSNFTNCSSTNNVDLIMGGNGTYNLNYVIWGGSYQTVTCMNTSYCYINNSNFSETYFRNTNSAHIILTDSDINSGSPGLYDTSIIESTNYGTRKYSKINTGVDIWGSSSSLMIKGYWSLTNFDLVGTSRYFNRQIPICLYNDTGTIHLSAGNNVSIVSNGDNISNYSALTDANGCALINVYPIKSPSEIINISVNGVYQRNISVSANSNETDQSGSVVGIKIANVQGDNYAPSISGISSNTTEIYLNYSARFNATIIDNVMVDSVKFNIQMPNGTTINATYTGHTDNHYWIDCNQTSTICKTDFAGKYNLTSVWANDTSNNVNSSSSVSYFNTSVMPNLAPYIPSLNSPANLASKQALTVLLNVTVSDPNNDLTNVTFINAADNTTLCHNESIVSGSSVSCMWSGLLPESSYQWYVNISDGSFTTNGSVWSFSTILNGTYVLSFIHRDNMPYVGPTYSYTHRFYIFLDNGTSNISLINSSGLDYWDVAGDEQYGNVSFDFRDQLVKDGSRICFRDYNNGRYGISLLYNISFKHDGLDLNFGEWNITNTTQPPRYSRMTKVKDDWILLGTTLSSNGNYTQFCTGLIKSGQELSIKQSGLTFNKTIYRIGQGDSIQINVTVNNTGEINETSANVSLYFDDVLNQTLTGIIINSNSSKTISFNKTISFGNKNYLKVMSIVIPSNVSAEGMSDNNYAVKYIVRSRPYLLFNDSNSTYGYSHLNQFPYSNWSANMQSELATCYSYTYTSTSLAETTKAPCCVTLAAYYLLNTSRTSYANKAISCLENIGRGTGNYIANRSLDGNVTPNTYLNDSEVQHYGLEGSGNGYNELKAYGIAYDWMHSYAVQNNMDANLTKIRDGLALLAATGQLIGREIYGYGDSYSEGWTGTSIYPFGDYGEGKMDIMGMFGVNALSIIDYDGQYSDLDQSPDFWIWYWEQDLLNQSITSYRPLYTHMMDQDGLYREGVGYAAYHGHPEFFVYSMYKNTFTDKPSLQDKYNLVNNSPLTYVYTTEPNGRPMRISCIGWNQMPGSVAISSSSYAVGSSERAAVNWYIKNVLSAGYNYNSFGAVQDAIKIFTYDDSEANTPTQTSWCSGDKHECVLRTGWNRSDIYVFMKSHNITTLSGHQATEPDQLTFDIFAKGAYLLPDAADARSLGLSYGVPIAMSDGLSSRGHNTIEIYSKGEYNSLPKGKGPYGSDEQAHCFNPSFIDSSLLSGSISYVKGHLNATDGTTYPNSSIDNPAYWERELMLIGNDSDAYVISIDRLSSINPNIYRLNIPFGSANGHIGSDNNFSHWALGNFTMDGNDVPWYNYINPDINNWSIQSNQTNIQNITWKSESATDNIVTFSQPVNLSINLNPARNLTVNASVMKYGGYGVAYEWINPYVFLKIPSSTNVKQIYVYVPKNSSDAEPVIANISVSGSALNVSYATMISRNGKRDYIYAGDGENVSFDGISTNAKTLFIRNETIVRNIIGYELKNISVNGVNYITANRSFDYIMASYSSDGKNITIKSDSNHTINATIKIGCSAGLIAKRDGVILAYGSDYGCVNASYAWIKMVHGSEHTFELFGEGTSENIAPSSTLNSPTNGNISTTQSITFNCSATDDRNLANITLYGNWSGWHANETKSVGGQSNSTTFTKTLSDGSYKWNCLAQDNDTSTSFANQNYTFIIDTSQPPGVSGLSNQSAGSNWIYWTWTNPSGDWNHTEVWINGTWYANVITNYYNATGLSQNSWYEIQLRTADNLGNINATWVNSSAKTSLDSTAPTISFVSVNSTNASINGSLRFNASVSGNNEINLVKFNVNAPYGTYNLTADNQEIGNITSNLSDSDQANWIGTDAINSIYVFNSTNIYLGLSNGKFGVYNSIINISHNLSGSDTGNWIGASNINSVLGWNYTNIYLGMDSGKFGVYNSLNNITSDLSATDIGNWIGGDNIVSVLPVSSSTVYLLTSTGMFGVYNPLTNITYDLSSTDINNWMDGYSGLSMAELNSTYIFIGMSNGKFGFYNISSNTTIDLSTSDPSDWITSSSIYSISALNYTNIYMGVGSGKLGAYDLITNITSDLSSSDAGNWIGANNIYSVFAYNSTDIYLGIGNGRLGLYDSLFNVTTDLSSTDANNWIGTSNITSISLFNKTNAYMGMSNGKFGLYERAHASSHYYLICNSSNTCNTSQLGQYNLTSVWANDTNNNVAANNSPLKNFTILDTTSPVITSITANASNTTQNGSIRFNATVTDFSAIGTVKFNIQTPSGTYNITATNSSATHFYIICNSTNTCNTSMVGQYNLTSVWANDTYNNVIFNSSPLINFTVLDSTPPVITIISPANTTFARNWTMTNISVNEPASWCGVSLNGTANQSLTNSSSTSWYLNISVAEGQNNVVFYCNDSLNNTGNTTTRYFTSDLTPPPGVSGLANQSSGGSWIYWSWTNPSGDFNHTEVWLNGTFIENTTGEYYNATTLNQNSWYELQIRTADNLGNVNETFVNSSARTGPDFTGPVITIISPANTTYGIYNWTWANITTDENASSCKVSLNGTANQTMTNSSPTSWYINISVAEGQNNVTFYCNDSLNNNGSSSVNYFSSDITPSSGVADLFVLSSDYTFIYWAWTNPGSDWNHTEVWINGTWYVNTTLDYYLLSSITPGSVYQIGLKTADNFGNVNNTWVNLTSSSTADNEAPTISEMHVSNTSIIANEAVMINATVTDNYMVGTVKFAIQTPYGDLNITAENNSATNFYVVCDPSNLCVTSMVGQYNLTGIWADDMNGNVAIEITSINFTVLDSTPPVITTISPANTTYTQNWTMTNISVNEPASWCGVSLNGTANQSLSNSSSTSWYLNISVADGNNDVIFYCNDTTGNMANSSSRYFVMNALPPQGVSDIYHIDLGERWIFWSWNNPSGDFDHVEIWLNGTFLENITNNYYNASGLIPNTTYQIEIITVDNAGNRNTTPVIDSAQTLSSYSVPIITSISPSNITYNTSWVWANISLDQHASWCGVSLNGTANQTMTELNSTYWYLNISIANGQNNATFYCNDTLGNMTNSSTVYFTVNYTINETPSTTTTTVVTQPSSGGGGGGGGWAPPATNATTTTRTTTTTVRTTTTVYIPPKVEYTTNLTGDVPNVVQKVSPEAEIKQITIVPKADTVNAKIVTQQVMEKPVTVMQAPAKHVYKYMEIKVENLPTESINYSIIQFTVEKSWLAEKNMSKNSVKLNRYVHGAWTKLNTSLVSANWTHYFYEAQTPGFSYFAITAETEEEIAENVPESGFALPSISLPAFEVPDLALMIEAAIAFAILLILVIKRNAIKDAIHDMGMPKFRNPPEFVSNMNTKKTLFNENDKNLTDSVNLRNGVPSMIKIKNYDAGVRQIILQANASISGFRMKIVPLPKLPSIIRQEPSGEIYKYIEIMPPESLHTWDIEFAKIQFRVEKSWLNLMHIPENGVNISRYYGGRWMRIKPKIVGREGNSIIYEITTEGFFTFAISGEPGI